MSELCLSNTSKNTQFSTLLFSDLLLFFNFILSHPLYFSYFIFFSPYLVKLLSFLSPLFITTSLLLLAFLTLSPGPIHDNIPPQNPESELGFLICTYHSIAERLRPKKDDGDIEFHHFEELEVFKIVFETYTIYANDEVAEMRSEENCEIVVNGEALVANLEEKTVEVAWEEKRVEGFLKELDEFENVSFYMEEERIQQLGIKSDEVEVSEEVLLVRSKSEPMGDKIGDGRDKDSTYNGGEYTSDKFLESQSSCTLDTCLGSYGSMRKEKEWRRTLACKLYEERHNVDGGEGMDSLWETYETDSSNKAKPKSNTKNKKNKKKNNFEYYEGDDGYDEEDVDANLCCLQALKFSAGKINLGMGRPNLVKISKAIKGFGWLHNVTRHGKRRV